MIVYTVAETTKYPGYTASTTDPVDSGKAITNTQEPTTADATKAWKNADGTTEAPEGATVEFTLYADGTATSYKVTLDGTTDETVPTVTGGYESEAWTATFVNLPKYQAGTDTAIVYTVAETTGYTGYTASTTEAVASGETITNTQEPTTALATKTWKNADGSTTAPASGSVVFTLYADGEATKYTVTLDGTPDAVPEVTGGYESAAWTARFSHLPKTNSVTGKDITYTIAETTTYPGYTASTDKPVANGESITNTQDPTTANATKEWKNADGTTTAPEGATVVYTLYADGETTKYTVTLDGTADEKPEGTAGYESEAWKAEFINLPKYQTGTTTEIVYTVAETTKYPGYTASTEKPVASGEAITNTQESTTADATKAWKNADGTTTAPEGATVVFTLYADGEATKYTVTLDGTAETDAPIVTGGYESEAWKAEFVNLPKYKAGTDTAIVYTVAETTGYTGYTASTEKPVASGETITNSQDPTETNAKKAWENADGTTTAPEGAKVVFTLYADGEVTEYKVTLDGTVDTAPTVTGGYESAAWTAEFVNLPKYQTGTTTEIVYTVAETTTYPGYTASTDKPVATGGTITNTQEPTTANATKEWKNADGTTEAPEGGTVEFTLYADGTATDYKVTLDGTVDTAPSGTGGHESPAWTATFVNLPKYQTGTTTEIVYTVAETKGYTGYTASTTDPVESGKTITNTQDVTEAYALKAWKNNESTEAPEGGKVTFTLYADGVATEYTVELDGTAETTAPTTTGGYESEAWKATFVNLPKTNSTTGKEITYTIAETGFFPNYSPSTTDPVASGSTITNKHTDSKKDVITGEVKTSVDGALVEPGQVLTYEITYTNNTSKVGTVTVTDKIPANTTIDESSISDGGNYSDGTITWTITDVAAGASGKVSFSVTVNDSTNGVTITNDAIVNDGTNESNTNVTTITVPDKDVKVNDGEPKVEGPVQVGDVLTYDVNYEITQPMEKVVVTDEVPAGTTYVEDSATNGGVYSGGKVTWTFENVAVGKYTVSFKAVVNNEAVTLTEIVNTATIKVNDNPEVHTNPVKNTPETTAVTVKKVWDDEDFDGRPASVTVNLKANGGTPAQTAVESPAQTLSADNNWTYTWNDLPTRTEDGEDITWTIVEDAVDGYSTTYASETDTEKSLTTITVTNTHRDNEKEVFSGGTTIMVDNAVVEAGQKLTYKITYVNNSSSKAVVKVTDKIPTNTTIVDGSISNGGVLTDGTITWEIADVEPGASGEVTFDVTVNDVSGVTITNDATVIVGNNTSNTNTTTITVPEKDVTDESGTSIADGDVQVGDVLTYEISYEVTDLMEKVVVTDVVPEGTTYETDSASDGGVYADGKVTWTFTNVAAGKYTVSFKVRVNNSALKVDKINNTATIKVNDNPEVRTNPVENTPESTTVTVLKEWDDNDYDERPTSVTVNLKANGETPAETAVASPAQTLSAENDWTYTWNNLPTQTEDGKEITWTVVEDTVSGYTTTYSGTGTKDDPIVVTNTHKENEKDVVSSQDTKTSVDGELVEAGDTLTYSIDYVNNTNGVGTVTIEDTIPANTTYVEGSASDGGVYADGKITWTIENVPAGGTGTVTFQVTVNDDSNGETIENTAKVNDGENDFSTNAVTTSVPLKEVQDTEGNDIDGESVKIGDELSYIVSFTITKDATSVVITDVIPQGTTYVEGSADNGGILSGGVLTWDLGELKAGTYSVSFKVTVNNDALKLDAITNTASISVNNHAEVKTNTVTNTPETTNVTVTKVWVDEDNKAQLRPESVTVHLLANDVEYGDAATLSEDNDWTFTWDKLPTQTEKAEAITWTVSEDTVDKYTTEISGNASTGFKVTNSLQTGNVTITKEVVLPKGAEPKLTEFTFNISLSASGEYAYTGDKEGTISQSGTVTLKGGESITIKGLPIGSTYEVSETEANTGGYTTTYTNESGTISATGETVKVTVKNEYKFTPTTAVIEVYKRVYATGSTADKIIQLNSAKAEEEKTEEPAEETPAPENQEETPETTEAPEATEAPETTEAPAETTAPEVVPEETTPEVTTEEPVPAVTEVPVVEEEANAAEDLVSLLRGMSLFTTVYAEETAEATAVPETTEVPAETTVPAVAEETAETVEEPAPTATPAETLVPVFTEEPVATEAPEATATAEATAVPTGTPEATATAEATATPEGTPEATATAEATAAPTAEAEEEKTEEEDPVEGSFEAMLKGLEYVILGTAKNGSTLVGLPVKEGDFEFTLDGEGVHEVVTNGAAGAGEAAEAVFSEIEYTEPGTYTYTITETKAPAWYQKNTQTVTATVTVVDDQEGHLVATVKYSPEERTFENYYVTNDVSVDFEGVKELNGRDLEAGEFTFELYDSEGNLLETAQNDATGKVKFSTITYTKADDLGAETEKTFTYTVKETSGSLGGVTYDTNEATITVTVKDDGEGNLTAEVTPAEAPLFTFTNTYEAEGEITLSGTKVLEGGELTEGQFSFELVDSEGNVVETVKNAADGTFSFSALKYYVKGDETNDLGKHIYKIREVIPDDTKGIAYTDKEYTVTIEVSDIGDGNLNVTSKPDAGSFSFTNKVLKVLVNKYNDSNKKLKGATITLYDENGAEIVSWTSDGKEPFDFGPYVEAGKKYMIKETKVPKGYTRFKPVVFTVDPDGTVNISLKVDKEGAYKLVDKTIPKEDTPPDKYIPPVVPLPPTDVNGGNSNTGMMGGMLAASMAGVIAALYQLLKSRKQYN